MNVGLTVTDSVTSIPSISSIASTPWQCFKSHHVEKENLCSTQMRPEYLLEENILDDFTFYFIIPISDALSEESSCSEAKIGGFAL